MNAANEQRLWSAVYAAEYERASKLVNLDTGAAITQAECSDVAHVAATEAIRRLRWQFNELKDEART